MVLKVLEDCLEDFGMFWQVGGTFCWVVLLLDVKRASSRPFSIQRSPAFIAKLKTRLQEVRSEKKPWQRTHDSNPSRFRSS